MASRRLLVGLVVCAGAALVSLAEPPPGIATPAAAPDSREKVCLLDPPEWGPETNGVSLNLTLPRRLYIGDPFGATVHSKGGAEVLLSGRDLISVLDVRRSMALELRPVGSVAAAPITLRSYDSGMPDVEDPGNSGREAAGERFLCQMEFLSAPSDHLLAPGFYMCTLRASAPKHADGDQHGKYSLPVSDGAKRCWFGSAVSNAVIVELVRPEPEKVTVLVPRVLRVGKGGARFSEADADKATFEIQRGHMMGAASTTVTFEKDANGARKERVESSGIGGHYLKPGTVGPLPLGGEVRLVVFSTNKRPAHFWIPSSGSGYRTLIERTVPIIGEDDPEPKQP